LHCGFGLRRISTPALSGAVIVLILRHLFAGAGSYRAPLRQAANLLFELKSEVGLHPTIVESPPDNTCRQHRYRGTPLSDLVPENRNRFSIKSRVFLLTALLLCSGLAQADIYRSLDPDTPTKYTNIVPTEGRWELYLKEMPVPTPEDPADERRLSALDGRSRYASQIRAAALANNVEAALIRAVIAVESGYNPSAVSRAGAVGLMQLMPGTAKRYNVTDLYNPEQNIHGGAQYLRDLLRLFNNNLHLAIAAYNAGEQAVMKYGNRIPPYRETVAYVPKVMKFYRQYSTAFALAEESGSKRYSPAVRKRAAQTRVSRTYLANPA
jgi:hypothetical protein